jgi:hypothetical protein
MTFNARTQLSLVRYALTVALAVAVATVGVLAATPAHAEKVVGHDNAGDADFYDIDSVAVRHGQERVRFTVRAFDRTPYRYDIKVDTPGGKPWKYVVIWSAYTPHRAFVQNRHQYRTDGGFRCKLWSARELNSRTVSLSVPVRCFMEPNRLRAKAKSWDDEAGYVDRSFWTGWVRQG